MPAYSLVVAKTEDAGVLAERADLRPASRNRRWGESVLWVCLRPGSTSNHVFNIEIFLPSQRTRLARCRWRDTCASTPSGRTIQRANSSHRGDQGDYPSPIVAG